ncbi:transposase [Spirosoma daeguense]
MQANRSVLWTLLIPAMLMMSCGKTQEEKEEEAKKDNESVSALGAVSALKDIASKAAGGSSVEVLDFRKLKELLPGDADGLPRKEATGEKDGAVGFTISTAEGKYGNEDGSETIELSIIDGGGSAMTIGIAAWSMIEVDKETANGYEKTTKIGDNKAFEKYDNNRKEGEIDVLVNKRFIVSAKGKGVSMDKIKAAFDDIDLDKLTELKEEK